MMRCAPIAGVSDASAGSLRAWRRGAWRCAGAVAVLASLLTSAACRDRDDLDGRRRPIEGLSAPAAAAVSAEAPLEHIAVDLIAARAGASVEQAGTLWVGFEGAAAAVHTEGSYRSAWHLGAVIDGRRCALVDGLGGEIHLPLTAEALDRIETSGASIEASVYPAVAGQLVTVLVNEKRVGDVRMGAPGWQTIAQTVPASVLRVGENKFRWYFKTAGTLAEHRSAAGFSELRFGPVQSGATANRADAPATPVRVESVDLGGGVRQALSVAAKVTLAYYLAIPSDDPALRFATQGPGPFEIAVMDGGSGEAAVVWRSAEQPPADNGLDHEVSLQPYAGRVVRLELRADAAGAWVQPRVVAPRADAAKSVVPSARPPLAAPDAADIIIVWSVAAWRRDVSADEKLSPAFALLARGASVFAHAYAAAADSAPSHVAVMTGRVPSGDHIGEGVPTLAEALGRAGYATGLVSGNGFVNDEAGFARGFDHYDNPMRLREPFAARLLWQRAKRYLQKRSEGRVFLYIAAVEPHLPYTPSSDSLALTWAGTTTPLAPNRTVAFAESVAKGARPTTDERAFLSALYQAEAHDVDSALGEMVRDLETMGLRSRTAIIVTGDVGEEVLEHGRIGHGGSLVREVVEVPLLVTLPPTTAEAGGREAMGRAAAAIATNRPVSTLDLYATIRSLAGLADDPLVPSTSLLRKGESRPVFIHLPKKGKSVVVAGYRAIIPLRGPYELYDLRADPSERVNRWGELPLVERYVRVIFGLGVAYEEAWSFSRWGTPQRPTEAFAADHGP